MYIIMVKNYQRIANYKDKKIDFVRIAFTLMRMATTFVGIAITSQDIDLLILWAIAIINNIKFVSKQYSMIRLLNILHRPLLKIISMTRLHAKHINTISTINVLDHSNIQIQLESSQKLQLQYYQKDGPAHQKVTCLQKINLILVVFKNQSYSKIGFPDLMKNFEELSKTQLDIFKKDKNYLQIVVLMLKIVSKMEIMKRRFALNELTTLNSFREKVEASLFNYLQHSNITRKKSLQKQNINIYMMIMAFIKEDNLSLNNQLAKKINFTYDFIATQQKRQIEDELSAFEAKEIIGKLLFRNKYTVLLKEEIITLKSIIAVIIEQFEQFNFTDQVYLTAKIIRIFPNQKLISTYLGQICSEVVLKHFEDQIGNILNYIYKNIAVMNTDEIQSILYINYQTWPQFTKIQFALEEKVYMEIRKLGTTYTIQDALKMLKYLSKLSQKGFRIQNKQKVKFKFFAKLIQFIANNWVYDPLAEIHFELVLDNLLDHEYFSITKYAEIATILNDSKIKLSARHMYNLTSLKFNLVECTLRSLFDKTPSQTDGIKKEIFVLKELPDNEKRYVVRLLYNLHLMNPENTIILELLENAKINFLSLIYSISYHQLSMRAHEIILIQNYSDNLLEIFAVNNKVLVTPLQRLCSPQHLKSNQSTLIFYLQNMISLLNSTELELFCKKNYEQISEVMVNNLIEKIRYLTKKNPLFDYHLFPKYLLVINYCFDKINDNIAAQSNLINLLLKHSDRIKNFNLDSKTFTIFWSLVNRIVQHHFNQLKFIQKSNKLKEFGDVQRDTIVMNLIKLLKNFVFSSLSKFTAEMEYFKFIEYLLSNLQVLSNESLECEYKKKLLYFKVVEKQIVVEVERLGIYKFHQKYWKILNKYPLIQRYTDQMQELYKLFKYNSIKQINYEVMVFMLMDHSNNVDYFGKYRKEFHKLIIEETNIQKMMFLINNVRPSNSKEIRIVMALVIKRIAATLHQENSKKGNLQPNYSKGFYKNQKDNETRKGKLFQNSSNKNTVKLQNSTSSEISKPSQIFVFTQTDETNAKVHKSQISIKDIIEFADNFRIVRMQELESVVSLLSQREFDVEKYKHTIQHYKQILKIGSRLVNYSIESRYIKLINQFLNQKENIRDIPDIPINQKERETKVGQKKLFQTMLTLKNKQISSQKIQSQQEIKLLMNQPKKTFLEKLVQYKTQEETKEMLAIKSTQVSSQKDQSQKEIKLFMNAPKKTNLEKLESSKRKGQASNKIKKQL